MTLFGRNFRLIVGTLDVSEFRCQFRVTRTLKSQANTAEVIVSNLGRNNRAYLEGLDVVPVELQAGYEQTHQIFLGNLRRAYTHLEGPTYITRISSSDGEEAMQKSTTSRTYPRGLPTYQVILEVARDLGLPGGNLEAAISGAKMTGTGSTTLPRAINVSGNAARELTALLASCGYDWSVQDGQLQVLAFGQSLVTEAVVLAPGTGLIGSPTIDNKGVMSGNAQMLPGLEPGRVVLVQSEFIQGQFRLDECVTVGDNRGVEWGVNFKGKAY